MNWSGFKYALGIGPLMLGAMFAACSSSSTKDTGTPVDGGTSSGACTNTTAYNLLFSPMYSAYDGTNTYQIPVVIEGQTVAGMQNFTWSASPASAVTIAPNTDATTGGVILTMNAAGAVTVTATLTGQTVCGQATLNVSQADTSQYALGKARYNTGFDAGVPDGASRLQEHIGNQGQPCAACHQPSAGAADAGPPALGNDISHTPEQTGGFSDTDLMNMYQHGEVPEGGTLIPVTNPISGMTLTAAEWSSFHTWQFQSTDEAQGVLWYLRSLPPAPQSGTVDFGGGGPHCGDAGMCGPPDGGFGDGGFPHGDGGGPGGGGGPSDATAGD